MPQIAARQTGAETWKIGILSKGQTQRETHSWFLQYTENMLNSYSWSCLPVLTTNELAVWYSNKYNDAHKKNEWLHRTTVVPYSVKKLIPPNISNSTPKLFGFQGALLLLKIYGHKPRLLNRNSFDNFAWSISLKMWFPQDQGDKKELKQHLEQLALTTAIESWTLPSTVTPLQLTKDQMGWLRQR